MLGIFARDIQRTLPSYNSAIIAQFFN